MGIEINKLERPRGIITTDKWPDSVVPDYRVSDGKLNEAKAKNSIRSGMRRNSRAATVDSCQYNRLLRKART